MTLHIRFARLDAGLPGPVQAHDHDAGYDLSARTRADLSPAGGRALVPTGIAVAIPPGYAGLVLPRSGLALNHGVTCLNTPGLIDPQYRGELKVLLVNTDPREPYTVTRGDRIAQLVITAVEAAVDWVEVDQLDDTTRDTFGFGSTGR
ncbi:MAG TPA: dUTP diphosphatase [Acidimicrobiia bacterium]|nr:dUTP diphosphatase [Acidimicrobiia bacterium]